MDAGIKGMYLQELCRLTIPLEALTDLSRLTEDDPLLFGETLLMEMLVQFVDIFKPQRWCSPTTLQIINTVLDMWFLVAFGGHAEQWREGLRLVRVA